MCQLYRLKCHNSNLVSDSEATYQEWEEGTNAEDTNTSPTAATGTMPKQQQSQLLKSTQTVVPDVGQTRAQRLAGGVKTRSVSRNDHITQLNEERFRTSRRSEAEPEGGTGGKKLKMPVGLTDAKGQGLPCSGLITFGIELAGRRTSVTAWVSPALRNRIIVGAGTLEDLGFSSVEGIPRWIDSDRTIEETRTLIVPGIGSAVTRSTTR